MSRLAQLEARRVDASIKTAAVLNEAYRGIRQGESVKYAIGAMQPIDQEYTKNTYLEGDRVKNQLSSRVATNCEFRYQGSVTNDTHIKARSDIDLLVFLTAWYWCKPPVQPASLYRGDPKADMRKLRNESEAAITTAFPEVEMDASGGKCISLGGGSLRRRVDVVPASWLNTIEYETYRDEAFRGVEVFDIERAEFVVNHPFLHNRRIDEKDKRTLGGMRKAARLMKSLMYDSSKLDMSSFNLVGIAYNIPDRMLCYMKPHELKILESCHLFCSELRTNSTLRDSIKVPDESRGVFEGMAGATTAQLDDLVSELNGLIQAIAAESAQSFVKLAESVEYTGVGGGLYTGVGGGLYTGVGGGLYTGVGGGLYTGPGGGMYTGPESEPYMSHMPPWPHFLREVEARGYQAQGRLIRQYLPQVLWPENFFR